MCRKSGPVLNINLSYLPVVSNLKLQTENFSAPGTDFSVSPALDVGVGIGGRVLLAGTTSLDIIFNYVHGIRSLTPLVEENTDKPNTLSVNANGFDVELAVVTPVKMGKLEVPLLLRGAIGMMNYEFSGRAYVPVRWLYEEGDNRDVRNLRAILGVGVDLGIARISLNWLYEGKGEPMQNTDSDDLYRTSMTPLHAFLLGFSVQLGHPISKYMPPFKSRWQ